MNIADRIQYLRKQKGYSQEELADKVGVSRQAVSKWESEQSTPDLEKVIAMSELFEVTTDYILKGIEPVSTTNRKTVKTLYLGFVLIFATIAGIWSFAANRFNYDEIIMIILAHLLKVEKYYQNKGIVVLDKDNYYLKLYVDFENIETIINNSSILINEDNYQYNIISISDLLESNYDNYQIFYLQILNPNKNLLVNNLVINYKILTGRESLIKYIKKIVKE